MSKHYINFNRSRQLVALLFLFHSSLCALSQPPEILALEKKVYQYNNRFQYDSSQKLIADFLQNPALLPEHRFYAFLYLSFTHKRLFNYPYALAYLDSALNYGLQTKQAAFYQNKIASQKAFVLFDTHRYGEADKVMTTLRNGEYKHLDTEEQSKIMMQEAYLFFLQKRYRTAQERYAVSLAKMKASSPCDQPMIYGKLVELYAAMEDDAAMNTAYRQAIRVADSCGILKYNIYATEMFSQALALSGRYREAIPYIHLKDSLEKIYNTEGYKDKMQKMELHYQAQRKEQQIALHQKTIHSQTLLIGLLVVSLVGLGFAGMYYALRFRQKKIQQDKINTQRYTLQLLKKTEEDRRRIAGHLHDSVSHELLSLKNMAGSYNVTDIQQRIDTLIDDVRQISRNLHPVIFERVGLAHSIVQLAERMQRQHQFLLNAEINYNKVLPADTELQLYRIVQEAVTNMVKHSGAIAGKITLQNSPSEVFLEIKDNGNGFDVQAALNGNKAFGLHNILERSKAAGGKAHIKSDTSGTTITIKAPTPK